VANEEHLRIFNQGVDGWNKWRLLEHGIRPNLSNTALSIFGKRRNFSKIDLSDTDLRETILFGANLSKANLADADLSGSDLDTAKLAGANLKGCNLTYTRFVFATLRGANLSSTNLVGTNLQHANLEKANLKGAILSGAILADVNLSGAKNLHYCKHQTPSALDFRTLQISGELPIVFLRGCGLPETVIEFLPSLLNKAIDFYSCFISYSSRDQVFTERLHADLQAKGVRCWFAPDHLRIGDKIRVAIDESIRKYEKLLLVLSKHSVESAWVEKEVETALEQERQQKRTILFPIKLDNSVMKIESGWPADIKRTRNIGDFQFWKNHDQYKKAFDRLLRDLKADTA
jgi:TIR domain/Pentapeptide repeats (8 copies)